uniref:nucleotidyltransferase family protein n=1 Tax=Sphingomonas bacterium TaxID=1895847 RepID=UPI00260FE6EC|nr:nucleotidyltransferase family protein [Sphingomonas bacterium]
MRCALRGEDPARPLDGDPSAMGLACYTSGLGPLLGFWAGQGRVSASRDIAAVLDLHLRHNRVRTRRLAAEARALCVALAGHQRLSVTLLGGLHTGPIYFPAPETRPLSDLDLMVEARDGPVIAAMLARRGFDPAIGASTRPPRRWVRPEVSAHPRTLDYLHADDPWSVDLHLSLDRLGPAGINALRFDRPETHGMREPWPVCSEAMVLSQPLLLLHLAVRASRDFRNLTLLRLVELALVVRHDEAAGRLSWPAFVALAERVGALGAAYPALRLCEQLVSGTVPPDVLESAWRRAPAVARRFVERLTPASAHRVTRYSITEKIMWATSRRSALRQLGAQLVSSDANPLSVFFPGHRQADDRFQPLVGR